MTENNHVEWPPKDWSLNMSGRSFVIMLSLLMFYMTLTHAIIFGSILYGFVLLNLWASRRIAKQKRELAELEAEMNRLRAEREFLNDQLFKKFGTYTNEYGYKYSKNNELSY